LAKAQGRVADQRRDGLHKLTTSLARQFGTIVVEDLQVAGMVKNIGSPGTSLTLHSGNCAGSWSTRRRPVVAGGRS